MLASVGVGHRHSLDAVRLGHRAADRADGQLFHLIGADASERGRGDDGVTVGLPGPHQAGAAAGGVLISDETAEDVVREVVDVSEGIYEALQEAVRGGIHGLRPGGGIGRTDQPTLCTHRKCGALAARRDDSRGHGARALDRGGVAAPVGDGGEIASGTIAELVTHRAGQRIECLQVAAGVAKHIDLAAVLRGESKIRQGGVAGQCGDYAADAGVGQITDVETAVRSYSNADRSV